MELSLWVEGLFQSLARTEYRDLSGWYANLGTVLGVVAHELTALRNGNVPKSEMVTLSFETSASWMVVITMLM